MHSPYGRKVSLASEIGIVSSESRPAPGGGAPASAGSYPRATRATATSRVVSRSSKRFTGSSMNPATSLAGISCAVAIASVWARIVPESQNACRYSLAWYLQALRQKMSVYTITAGAVAMLGSRSLASISVRRWSPARRRLNASSLGSKW